MAEMPHKHIAYQNWHLLPYYLVTGAVCKVPYPPWHTQLSSIAHLDTKAKEGLRLVLDLHIVNKWLAKVPIKFNTAAALLCTMQSVSWYQP